MVNGDIRVSVTLYAFEIKFDIPTKRKDGTNYNIEG